MERRSNSNVSWCDGNHITDQLWEGKMVTETAANLFQLVKAAAHEHIFCLPLIELWILFRHLTTNPCVQLILLLICELATNA